MLVLACSVADLVDLRGQEVAKNLTFVMSKSTGKQGIYNGTDRSRWQENPNDQNGKCKYGNCYDQSKVVLQKPEFWLTFKPGHVQYEAPVGKAVGFDLYFVNLHAYHIHINPFQLTADVDDDDSSASDWFQSGDWHDTLFVPVSRGAGKGSNRSNKRGGGRGGSHRVLMQTDHFTGPSVVHCHILMHEDKGMMVTINFTGVEGARYPPAYGYNGFLWPPVATQRIDSSCYSDSLEVKPPMFTGKRLGQCAYRSPPPPTAWKVLAIVLGSVLAAVLLGAAILQVVRHATSNSALAASDAAPEQHEPEGADSEPEGAIELM